MKKVSTVIITLNEEKNIEECIKSVLWTDEILVIDAFSKDRTVSICRKFKKVKVFKRKWRGYSEQKNFGISKCRNEWILSLDADERISDELKKELEGILENPLDDGYDIPRKNFYFGKWIRWGGNYPDYQLRLFNKNKGKFKNVMLHEGVRVRGKVKKLKNSIIHFTYENIDDYFTRFIRYTEIEKEIMISKKVKINIFSIFKNVFWIPIKKFISRYIFKLGFLDGLTGLIVLKLNNITKIISFYKYYLWYKQAKNEKKIN